MHNQFGHKQKGPLIEILGSARATGVYRRGQALQVYGLRTQITLAKTDVESQYATTLRI